MQGLVQSKENMSQVKCAFDDVLCVEVKGIHDSLMGLLPDNEKEKHDTWFKAKIMFDDEFISDVKKWVSKGSGSFDDVQCRLY